VTGDDYSRLASLGDRASELVQFVGNRAYMRIVDGHCAALEVDRAGRRFVCTVYAVRPTVCRELGRGSPECRCEIATKGDRPTAALLKLIA
jgi:Fe-S-cluster containining protein